MKIGLVCPYNLYKGGGVQECVLALQAGLAKRGHTALILTPDHYSHPEKHSPYVRLIGKAANIKSFHTTAQVSISVDINEVDDLLSAENFDVLHFHEPWVPLIARQILARSQSKHVATFHAKLPETAVSNTIKKAITPYTKSVLKNLDALTAVSSVAAEYVTQLTNKKVQIIPNGVDTQIFSVKHKRSEPNILFIGRLERRKGVKYLLNAFGLLQQKHPDAKLIIAGDGPYRQRLEEESKYLGLKNVDFLGFVTEKHKLDLLSRATVFCSPAIHGESFGIVLLEAMAANVPIVAADNPGYQSVLIESGLISLVNVKDHPEFARRLEILMFDEKIRSHWQSWSKNYIKQFDYEKIIDQYENLYKKVLNL